MLDWTLLDDFHFLRPWWLVGLVPLLAISWVRWRRQRAQSRWEGIIAPELLDHLLVKGTAARTITPNSIAFLLSLVAIIAVAGPSFRRAPNALFNDEAALVIVLDVSRSMEATDVQPSRLERAKQKVSDLLDVRPGAPTAMVAYAGSGHTVIPLTPDESITRNLLPAISAGIMPVAGKSPASALVVAGELLDARETPGTLLLITDAIPPEQQPAFAAYFGARDHQLLVWGMGDPQAEDSNFDEASLRQLAASCRGSYQELTLDNTDARRINRRTTQHLVAVANESSPWVDDGYFLVIPITLLLAVWFRPGWSLAWE